MNELINRSFFLFQGGMYTSSNTSTNSSRTSSFSGIEGDFNELHKNIRVSPPESSRESELTSNSSDGTAPQGNILFEICINEGIKDACMDRGHSMSLIERGVGDP